MSRLLFLLAVVIAVFLLLRSFRRKPPQQQDVPAAAEEMVRCAKCGVHLPKGESIMSGGNYYCSDACRREHTSK